MNGSPAEVSRSPAVNATADRVIDVLLLFNDKPVLTTQEICERLSMPRSTAYRYLSSLRSCALVLENERGAWRLGPQILSLARSAVAGTSIIDLSSDVISDLSHEFGESVSLYERVGDESFLLKRVEAQHQVRAIYSPGHILPWPGAASAKVLVAFAPVLDRKELLARMTPTRYTSHTIATKKGLKEALEKIVRDGYAFSDQERHDGVAGIAAPIGYDGQYNHCITLSGPAFRISPDRVEAFSASVTAAAHAISERLRSSRC